jgi:hypothetical protein
MSKENFLTKLFKRFKAGKQASQISSSASQPDEIMGKLLRMVENTDEVEIGCDEVFELLDQYVELEARGETVTELLPLVKKHLDRCRDCREEYEALARVFEATSPQD